MKTFIVSTPILVILSMFFISSGVAIAIPYRTGGKCSSSGIDIDLITGQTRSVFMPPDSSCYQEQPSKQQPSQVNYQFRFSNNCSRPVTVALGYRNLKNSWEAAGWWSFAPGEKAIISSKDSPIVSTNRIFYFYAETIDRDNRLIWQGNTQMLLDGKRLGFREVRNTKGNNNDFSVKCK